VPLLVAAIEIVIEIVVAIEEIVVVTEVAKRIAAMIDGAVTEIEAEETVTIGELAEEAEVAVVALAAAGAGARAGAGAGARAGHAKDPICFPLFPQMQGL